MYFRSLPFAVLFYIAGSLLAPVSLEAQKPSIHDSRLKPPLRDSIRTILDSARSHDIPKTLLTDKAIEGVSKGAQSDVVLKAVRNLYEQLKTVRMILGKVPAAELDAATAALRAGASTSSITLIKSSLPKRSRVVPYAVLSTLLQQGIPVADATKVVIEEGKKSDDRSLLALSTAIERNIAAGLQIQAAIGRAQEALPHATTRPQDKSPPPPRNAR